MAAYPIVRMQHSSLNSGIYRAPSTGAGRGGGPAFRAQPLDTEAEDRLRTLRVTVEEIASCLKEREAVFVSSGVPSLHDAFSFLSSRFPGVRPTQLPDTAVQANAAMGSIVSISQSWRLENSLPLANLPNAKVIVSTPFDYIEECIGKILDEEKGMVKKLSEVLGKSADQIQIKPGVNAQDLIEALDDPKKNGLSEWRKLRASLEPIFEQVEIIKDKRQGTQISRENKLISLDCTSPSLKVTSRHRLIQDDSPTARFNFIRDAKSPVNLLRKPKIYLSRTVGAIVGGLGIPGAIAMLSRIPYQSGEFPSVIDTWLGAVPKYFAQNRIINPPESLSLMDIGMSLISNMANPVTHAAFAAALAGFVGLSLRKYLLPPYGLSRNVIYKENGVQSARWSSPFSSHIKIGAVSLAAGGILPAILPLFGRLDFMGLYGLSLFTFCSVGAFLTLQAAKFATFSVLNGIDKGFEGILDNLEKKLDKFEGHFRL